MAKAETITLKRSDYDALVTRNEELEDLLEARDADDGSRIPHEVALAVMNGTSPCAAFRKHLGMTLRDLSEKTGSPRVTFPRSSAVSNPDLPQCCPGSQVYLARPSMHWSRLVEMLGWSLEGLVGKLS